MDGYLDGWTNGWILGWMKESGMYRIGIVSGECYVNVS